METAFQFGDFLAFLPSETSLEGWKRDRLAEEEEREALPKLP